MNLNLTPEQSAFRDEVRAFIKAELPKDISARLRLGHPARKTDIVRWQTLLHARGWAAPHWPREFGGAGLGTVERVILLDEIARASAPMPQAFNIAMLGPVLLRFGTPAQKAQFLPKLASCELWFCQGFSEPDAGSDLASLRTRARREGDHYVVDGQKIWTTTAHDADWIFALVRTDATVTRKQDGISFVLIDLRSPGVTIRPIVSIDGHHHLNEVFFDGVKVPVENLVGEEGRGWDCAKYLLGSERATIANVGGCWERLDFAQELVAKTRPGDKKLSAELAAFGAEIRALELTNWRFLLDPDTARTTPGFASVLKLKGSELIQELTTLIARLSGPQGLERRKDEDVGEGELAGHPQAGAVSRYLFQRATTIYGGSSEVQKDILAKTILG